ncbi:MAG TPA: hypothetical protein DEB39_16885, partial [Planctomycetaceae bacterium]|nr:hypothetical protein [Planctomycetaceae bacterium]
MSALTDVLTRLSTGLRINSGKDDPAGMIASELLKSDIVATTTAVKNTQQANSMFAVADSALGQISSLLNDIRGLVNEAANAGAMSDEQIAANQLQVDASLDSIDRISKTTNYQGKLLLDGSLGFTTEGVDNSKLESLNIYQANFGTAEQVDVEIRVSKVAESAKLFFNQGGVSEDVVIEVGGNLGSQAFTFKAGASVEDMARQINFLSDSTGVKATVGKEATYGQLLATSAGFNNDINFTAVQAGAAGGNYAIKYVAGNSDKTTYTITPPTAASAGIIEFQLRMDPWGYSSNADIDQALDGVYTRELANGFTVQSESGKVVRSYSIDMQTWDGVADSPSSYPAIDYNPTTGHMQITLIKDPDTGDVMTTYQQLVDTINGVDGLSVVQLSGDGSKALTDTVDLWTGTADAIGDPVTSTMTKDVRANNSLNITATTPGSQFDNNDVIILQNPDPSVTDITFDYVSAATKAAVIVTNGQSGGALNTATQFLKLTAKTTGAQFNDIGIEFIPTAGATQKPVTVSYDEANGVIRVYGGAGVSTLGDLKEAIEANSPFTADFLTDLTLTTRANLGDKMQFTDVQSSMYTASGVLKTPILTGQSAEYTGTDHPGLVITAPSGATAKQIADAFKDHPLSNLFSIGYNDDGSGRVFWNAAVGDPLGYADPAAWVYSGALQGGTTGYSSSVTAQELVDFVNNDETLSKLIHADLALNSPTGTGKLTLFEEYAYYGDP